MYVIGLLMQFLNDILQYTKNIFYHHKLSVTTNLIYIILVTKSHKYLHALYIFHGLLSFS